MAGPPPTPSAYAALWELEDSIARLDNVAEGLRIIFARTPNVDDAAEALIALRRVEATLDMLRDWRGRKEGRDGAEALGPLPQ
jgi:hypothetical protein